MLIFMHSVLGTPPGVVEKGLGELVIRPSGQVRAQAGGAMIDTWSTGTTSTSATPREGWSSKGGSAGGCSSG